MVTQDRTSLYTGGHQDSNYCILKQFLHADVLYVCVCVTEYPGQFPVKEMRLVPAVCGSLVVPLVYQLAVELRLSRWAALLAAAFILLGERHTLSGTVV